MKAIVIQTPHSFRGFKEMVKSKGGVWNSDDVYFTQFRDGWSASYIPKYPEYSSEDQAISYNWFSRLWKYTGSKEYNEQYMKL